MVQGLGDRDKRKSSPRSPITSVNMFHSEHCMNVDRSNHTRRLVGRSVIPLSIQNLQNARLNLLKLRRKLLPHSSLDLCTFFPFHKRSAWFDMAIRNIFAMGLWPSYTGVDECSASDLGRSAEKPLQQVYNRVGHFAHELTMAPSRI